MPSAIVFLEVVLGVLITLTVLAVVGTFVRRRVIAGGTALTVCGLRSSQNRRWRLGLMRYGPDALEWFLLGGFSVRPRYRWDRSAMLLEAPRDLGRSESVSLIPSAVAVAVTMPQNAFELAMSAPAYTALRAWQEAAPPGHNISVVA